MLSLHTFLTVWQQRFWRSVNRRNLCLSWHWWHFQLTPTCTDTGASNLRQQSFKRCLWWRPSGKHQIAPCLQYLCNLIPQPSAMCVVSQIFTNTSLLWPWEGKVSDEDCSSKHRGGLVVLWSRPSLRDKCINIGSDHTASISSCFQKATVLLFTAYFLVSWFLARYVCSTQSMTPPFVCSVSRGTIISFCSKENGMKDVGFFLRKLQQPFKKKNLMW